MSSLTTKQKVIVGVVMGVIVIIIGIYGYSMIRQEEEWEEGPLIGNENSQNEAIAQENRGEMENVTEHSNNVTQNEELGEKIIIHITGAVQKTGILVLPVGARIADAIDAAGGNTENADLDEVNLAYVLQDGQKIYIPSKEDKAKIESKAYIMNGSGNNVIVQTINEDEKGENRRVNINTATQSELENLPGVGESIASRIIEYRQQNGKFSKIEDLQNVKGIGDAKFNKMKEYIMVQ